MNKSGNSGTFTKALGFLAIGCMGASTTASAEDSEADLAKKLSNPVAALISVPFQFNYDGRIGPANKGNRETLNIQPVIPITLNQDWNVISRTIAPLVTQSNIFPRSGTQTGLGDVTQSFFLSPSQPGANGIVWGIGPVMLLPTGSQTLLSAHQWGAGPTVVALKQSDGWTVGVLANHIWSFASTLNNAANVNSSYVQPFISYTTADRWTFTLNTESTYNWETYKATVPINFVVSKLIKIDKLPVSLGLGVRYYAVSPNSGPKGFGARAVMTFLFPK